MRLARLLPVLLLLAAAVAAAGCLEQVRESVGAEPSHSWATKAQFEESVTVESSLASGSGPTADRQETFSLPFGSTDLRMTVDVEVPDLGNVTVSLSSPAETVYSRAYDSTAQDSFQTTAPTTGTWDVEASLQGESSVAVQVDARIPVD